MLAAQARRLRSVNVTAVATRFKHNTRRSDTVSLLRKPAIFTNSTETHASQWHSSYGSNKRSLSTMGKHSQQQITPQEDPSSREHHQATQPRSRANLGENNQSQPQAPRRGSKKSNRTNSEANTSRRTQQQQKQEIKQNLWTLVSPLALETETVRLIQQCHENSNITTSNNKVVEVDTLKRSCFDIMEAWTLHAKREQNLESAKRAESLLKTVEEQLRIIPRLACYESIIRAYISCDSSSNNNHKNNHNNSSSDFVAAADRAEKILNHVAKYTPHTPSSRAYNQVITAFANSGGEQAAEKAAALRQSMITAFGGVDQSDAESIQAEMKAWSKSGHPKAPEHILQMLLTSIQNWTESRQQRAEPSNKSKNNKRSSLILAPSEAMFHAAMGALAKSATQHKQRSVRQVAHQLDEIAKLMIERQHDWQLTPSLRTFMIVLGAWERVERVEKQGDAAKRAESLLEFMIESAIDQEQEPSSLFQTPPQQQTKAAMVTNISFTSVMVAWCHASQPERAEVLYQRLVQLHKSTNDPKLLPTTYMANTILAGWARMGKPDRVMDMIRRMQRVAIDTKHPSCQLDVRTFNMLLSAFAKAGQPNDSLALLDWLENHQQKNNARNRQELGATDSFAALFNPVAIRGLEQPNDVSYSCVLEVLGKKGLMRNVETTLEHMKERNITPSQIAYTSVIHGYSFNYHDPSNVSRANEIFQQVVATHKPDVICCTAMLNVCSGSHPTERDLALDLAMQVYGGLGPRERNDKTYKGMASVIKRLVVWQKSDADNNSRPWSTPSEAESEQKRMLQKLARECCGTGCLSHGVVRIIEQVLGNGKAAATMGRDRLDPSWCRKVKPVDWPKL